MSFEINGNTWTPQSAQEHALSIMERVNALLQEHNVTDEQGNVIQLQANFANALYLLSLGDGDRMASNDEKLSAAINSFNIELCDDAQIENLLPIAAMGRNTGSYSTLLLTATASADGDCLIPAGTKAPYNDVNFVVTADTLIEAGTYAKVPTRCDTVGAITVLTGEITSFDTSIANLESVVNEESSVPGTNPETVSELRQRLIKGDTIRYSTDGCKNALEELTGVTYARVYFNPSPTANLTLDGGVVISPRHAYIVIYGESDKIAETYTRYMSAETQNSPIAAGTPSTVEVVCTAEEGSTACTIPQGTSATYNGKTFEASEQTVIQAGESETITLTCTENGPNEVPARAITAFDQVIANLESVTNIDPAIPGTDDPKREQTYVSASGQTMTVKYDEAPEKKVYVKIILEDPNQLTNQIINQLKRDMIVSSASWGIGASVTSLLAGKPFNNITYADVAYVQVSDDGETWSNITQVGCNVVPRVYDSTIKVEALPS